MKKLFCIVLAICLSVSLIGCSRRASAESVVEDAIQAFQSADSSEIQQYWGDSDFAVETPESSALDEVYGQQLLDIFASSLTYQIIDSTEDSNAETAEVTVEFTNIDMSTVLPEWIGEVFSISLGYAFLPADQQPSEEDLTEMYIEKLIRLIETHADDKVTHTVDISLTLIENSWKIDIDSTNAALDAMVGGMLSGLSAINETGPSSQEETASVLKTPTEPLRTNPAVLGDYSVEIQSATLTQDFTGNPVIVISYSWTNNSSETTSPFFSISTSVFQDGIRLNSTVLMDNSMYDSRMFTADVRPGTTVNVQEAFALNNTTSPVEVEITEAFLWGTPTEIAYMQFSFD